MFECKACEARIQEITHLRAIITEMQAATEKAQARVMELAEPGVNRRMSRPQEPAARIPRPLPVPQEFPGYESRRAEMVVVVDEAMS